MKKRALAILLTLTLLLGLLPVGVTAIDAASGTCGENLTWTLEDGVLTISGEGAMADYSIDDLAPWKSKSNEISTVKIEEGVTSIGNVAFSGCNNLTNVDIPYGVTLIGAGAFDGTRLASVNLPDSVTVIGCMAFGNCNLLTAVMIPSSVTSIEVDAFLSCERLAKIDVASDNTCYVSVDGVVFNRDMTELIRFPEGKTGTYSIPDGVTAIGDGAFHSCVGLTEVTIPSSVTTIGTYAFAVCLGLENMIVPNGVTSIGAYAFKNCQFTDIVIPGSMESIEERILDNCNALTSITIPTSVISVENYAFWYCSSLRDVYYCGTETEWINVAIGSKGNNQLTSANIHYESHQTELRNDKDATCTEEGYTGDEICIICGKTVKQGAVISAAGHTWNTGEITKEPTHTEAGVKTFTCTVCGDQKTESIPATGSCDALDNVTITSTNPHVTGNILYWNPVADAKYYQIFRRTSGKPFEWLTNTGGTAYKDTTAKEGVAYIYAMKASDGFVRSASYSNTVTVTRPSNTPANVKINKTNAHKTGNILYWNGVSGAKFYQIFRRTSGQPFEWLTNTGSVAYKDETAKAGTQYIYAIKAHNGSAKSAAYSNSVTMTRPKG